MAQKVIRVGHSLAVIIPKVYIRQLGWKVGQLVNVEYDTELKMMIVESLETRSSKKDNVREFLNWLKKFNARHKGALAELGRIK